jgi:DNA-binding MarR family transcriptional regulator
MQPDSTTRPDRRYHAAGSSMVASDDARWLADYLRKLISGRPAVWAGSDMTLGQLLALHFISAQAPITVMALSEVLGTRPPATSAMVDRLAKAGLVRRMPDSIDRRRVLLAVTGQAAAMIGKADLQTARRLQLVLNSMGAAAQRCLTEVIKETARRLAR